jgi:3-hydroxyisobutyrate dehydrogenase-like beta-hydroxyacid dehydrogenase
MTVGFIGLGTIGFPIAKHIALKQGSLLFYARRQDVIAAAKAFGGEATASVAELGSRADVVVIFVNTYSQCLDCVDELLTTMKGGIIAIGATISPGEMEHIEKLCVEKGIGAVATPVTGGVQGAKDASLTVITSGDAQLIKRCQAIFSCYAAKIVRAGDRIAAAHSLKALVQLLVSINTVAMSEAYQLGMSYGIDPEIIYDTVVNSAGTSRVFENRGQTVLDRDFSKRGTISIINKDLEICSQMAMRTHIPLFLGSVCKQLFSAAVRGIDVDEDFSAIVKVYENLTSIIVQQQITEDGEDHAL